MTTINFHHPARLYLGVDRATALAQGAKAFPYAAHAIRFALEEVAPVSLRGAMLVIGSDAYSGAQMREFYNSPAYPLKRKADIAREFA